MGSHPLATLIDDIRRTNGWSLQQIQDQAASSGYRLSKQNLSRVMNSTPIAIKGDLISALAAGLRTTRVNVALAALASIGISIPSGAILSVEDAVRMDARLTERDKRQIIHLVQNMRSDQPYLDGVSGVPETPSPSYYEPEFRRGKEKETAGEGGRVETKQRRKGSAAERHPDDDILDGFA